MPRGAGSRDAAGVVPSAVSYAACMASFARLSCGCPTGAANPATTCVVSTPGIGVWPSLASAGPPVPTAVRRAASTATRATRCFMDTISPVQPGARCAGSNLPPALRWFQTVLEIGHTPAQQGLTGRRAEPCCLSSSHALSAREGSQYYGILRPGGYGIDVTAPGPDSKEPRLAPGFST